VCRESWGALPQAGSELRYEQASVAPVYSEGPPDGLGAAPHPARTYPFRFSGSAPEYFRIWIVSMLLTIVTLGGYGAWAKVRKRRYLYGHTWVAGTNFDFHGDPRAIFRGRLIALVAFGAYTALGFVAPMLATALLLVLAPLGPVLLLRSMRFVSANSSFRNVRFAFHGRYWDAARAIGPLLVWPLVVLLQSEDLGAPGESWAEVGWGFAPLLGFAALHPWMMRSRWDMRIGGTAFGTAALRSGTSLLSFYGIYTQAVGLASAGLILAVMGTSWVVTLRKVVGSHWLVLLAIVPWFLLAIAVTAFTRARVANLALGSTQIGTHIRLRSEVRALTLARMYLVNTIAVTASLGCLVPWAVVRTARYRATTLSLVVDGSLDDILAGVVQPASAAGDELAGLFDFDLSL
jgi:uncharacterized membrane protein YjgN (DUF898 family)